MTRDAEPKRSGVYLPKPENYNSKKRDRRDEAMLQATLLENLKTQVSAQSVIIGIMEQQKSELQEIAYGSSAAAEFNVSTPSPSVAPHLASSSSSSSGSDALGQTAKASLPIPPPPPPPPTQVPTPPWKRPRPTQAQSHYTTAHSHT